MAAATYVGRVGALAVIGGRTAGVAAALTVTALLGAPVSGAEPAGPEPGSACSLNLTEALTRTSAGEPTLICVDHGDGSYRWETYPSPYPLSDRWFSSGPELLLRGQGLRNPEMMAGRWTGYPQDPDGRCSAEQVEVVHAGEVGPAPSVAGEPGEPVEVEVSPTMYSLALTGHCMWQRAG